ncbi:MAG: sodium/proline symporter, partial [Myxococcota bacterium]
MSPVLIAFLAYLVVVLVAGVVTYRLNNTQEDFLLAGRRLNVWVATFSERASGESAWLLLGFPAAAMTTGLVKSWDAIGCVIGIIAAWYFVAEGLRRETERLGALTLPEYFARRFGDYAMAIRIVATLTIVFFYAFYVAAQFKGSGSILKVTFGIEEQTGIIIGAVVIILYTMAGGFFAVAWTDFFQALIMIGTLVILPIVGIYELSSRDIALTAGLQGNQASWTNGLSGGAAVVAVISGLSW